MTTTTIEAVRVWEGDGTSIEHPWDPETWYSVRDDYPYLDIRTSGLGVKAPRGSNIRLLADACDEGFQWQRWDLSEELSRKRRFGELSVTLNLPRETVRCGATSSRLHF